MSSIRHIDCERHELPGLPIRKPNAFGALAEGKLFYGKTGAEAADSVERANPIWLANEYVYYAIAARSRLRMPIAAVLCFQGKRFWGSEYIQNRNSLVDLVDGHDSRKSGELLVGICSKSKNAVAELARALLLDVALLNSDRQPWNILSWAKDVRNELYFFDHEKSLVGNGRKESDLVRVSDAALDERKIQDYLQCVDANNAVLKLLSEGELRTVFDSLTLNDGILKSALMDCPYEWMDQSSKDLVLGFLLKWWELLHGIVQARGVTSIIRLGKLQHS